MTTNPPPVLVRGSSGIWPFVIAGVLGAILLAVAGIFLLAKLDGPAAVFGILGAVVIAVGVAWGIRSRRQRLWITPTETGFIAQDRFGERTFADSQVLGSSLHERRNYSNGVLASFTRTFTVWLADADGPPEKMDMVNKLPLAGDDPLAELINRLNETLYEQAKADRASRRPVLGEKWRLVGSELTVFGDDEQLIKFDDIVAVDRVDDHLHIWRRGQDEAWARFRDKTVNAPLLCRLIMDHLETKPPESVATNQLGRLIFERRSQRSTVVTLGVLGGLFVVASFAFAIAGLLGSPELFWGLAVCGVLAAILIASAVYSATATFKCHQHGVMKRVFKKETTMFYRNMTAFTYSAVRNYHKGAYTGTTISLAFESETDGKTESLGYSTTIQGDDPTLETLREHVSAILAAQMKARADRGEDVKWTDHLRFLPAGLEFKPTKWFSKSQPIVIPYHDIRQFQLNDGTFNLFVGNEAKARVTESVDAKNFFPGYFMLSAMQPPD